MPLPVVYSLDDSNVSILSNMELPVDRTSALSCILEDVMSVEGDIEDEKATVDDPDWNMTEDSIPVGEENVEELVAMQ